MNRVVVGLSVALTAIATVVVLQWRQLREADHQVAQTLERVTALKADHLARTVGAAAPPAVLPSPVQMSGTSAAQVQAVVPAPVSGVAVQRETEPFESIDRMLASPEGREMLLGQLRMILPRQYPDLAKELDLSPAQEEKFFELLARQQADTRAETQRVRDSGPQDRAAIEERQRQAQERQRTHQAEVAAVLGAKVPEWQEYQRTLPVRRQVQLLKASLGSGGNALTDMQSRPLIQALAVEQARIQDEGRSAPRAGGTPQEFREQQLQRTMERNRRLLGVASSHLNPQQVESYRRMLEQEESLERTMMRIP